MNPELETRLKQETNEKQAKLLQRFFKTGKGEYGEGDIFLGIKVPVQRKIAKEFSGLGMQEIRELLESGVHEKRMIALFVLIDQYKKAAKEKNETGKKEIFDFYLANTAKINNWDLVDLSAPSIVGDYLLDKDRAILYKLARSSNLWERRIAMLSSFNFICNKDYKNTLNIADMLLNDKHDLIHKAVGWMLREIGKRVSTEVLETYLRENSRYKKMPRTMLRYSIERFPEEKRKKYLSGEM